MISIANATGCVTHSIAQAVNFNYTTTNFDIICYCFCCIVKCNIQIGNQKQNHLLQTQHFISSPEHTPCHPTANPLSEDLKIQSKKCNLPHTSKTFLFLYRLSKIPTSITMERGDSEFLSFSPQHFQKIRPPLYRGRGGLVGGGRLRKVNYWIYT